MRIDEEEGKILVDKKHERKLDLVCWQLAWDQYMLAAAMLGQMPWKVALAHKEDVMNVGLTASARKKSSLLGVLYDEVCRKDWEDMSGKLGNSFEISVPRGDKKDVLLKRCAAPCVEGAFVILRICTGQMISLRFCLVRRQRRQHVVQLMVPLRPRHSDRRTVR